MNRKNREKLLRILKFAEDVEKEAINFWLREFANVYIDDHNAGGLLFAEPAAGQGKNK